MWMEIFGGGRGGGICPLGVGGKWERDGGGLAVGGTFEAVGRWQFLSLNKKYYEAEKAPTVEDEKATSLPQASTKGRKRRKHIFHDFKIGEFFNSAIFIANSVLDDFSEFLETET